METMTIDKAIEVFNGFGLKYNLDSVIYMADHGKTPNELRADNNIKNLILLVQSGIADHDLDKTKEIIDKWLDNELGLTLLHTLIIDKMEKRHFFTDSLELELLTQLLEKGNQKGLIYKGIVEDLVSVQGQVNNIN